MAGQLAAAAATNSSILFPPSFWNKDLISERRATLYKKKNLNVKALAGKSATRLTAVSSSRLIAVSSPLFSDNHGLFSPRLMAVSSPLSTDNHGLFSLSVPKSRRSRSSTRPQAYIYHWSGFRIPANAEKPEWWWRTLSCIPYLIALQMSATGSCQPIANMVPYIILLFGYRGSGKK
ncbi:hypothetical protein TSUD_105110 [Trifolium subterraneum]|uniref:Protein TIC 20 n=1 Tax=Trifolium subterraneum TaxID=3900 RepID=A0A2Z6NMD5_TRISU|nr:hypothetical protein TSUD_105110 [Trifolium subterraneum]